jgi:hypothetical protein
MEEVVGSNPTRSTKTFQTLTVPPPARIWPPESNWRPFWTPNAIGKQSDRLIESQPLFSLGLSTLTETRHSRQVQPKLLTALG